MNIIAVIALSLAALCLAQTFATSGPDQPKTTNNIRVKRQHIVSLSCRCAKDKVWLGKCITCEEYLELTGDDSCPVCPPNTTANNLRLKRQAIKIVPSEVQCPIGKVWFKTRCVTCKMYFDLTDGDFTPECPSTTSNPAGQPKNAFNGRVKRQAAILPGYPCAIGKVWLRTRCVSCDEYLYNVGEVHPDCSNETYWNVANNVRIKRQAAIHFRCRCSNGRIWLRNKCVTCEMYLDLTGAESCPVCRPVKV